MVIEETIASNIRALRQARKMTLQNLENRSGLTKGYLSKIERGLKSPPFSTLNQIAIALGVDVAFLLKDASPETTDSRICFTKRGQGQRGKTDEEARGYTYEMLCSEKPGRNMIPYIIEVSRHEQQVFSHEGEEFLYVLEGSMEFFYDGVSYMMEAGDSVYFDSLVPHYGKGAGSAKTVLLAVMYNYKRL